LITRVDLLNYPRQQQSVRECSDLPARSGIGIPFPIGQQTTPHCMQAVTFQGQSAAAEPQAMPRRA
jgi:hypothetical protein